MNDIACERYLVLVGVRQGRAGKGYITRAIDTGGGRERRARAQQFFLFIGELYIGG